MELLPEAHLYWHNFDEYFTLLAFISDIDPCLVCHIVEKGYFTQLLDFYLVLNVYSNQIYSGNHRPIVLTTRMTSSEVHLEIK
jgi:hypothetical protein